MMGYVTMCLLASVHQLRITFFLQIIVNWLFCFKLLRAPDMDILIYLDPH